MNLFAYGTLKSPVIWQHIVGGLYKKKHGWLLGYKSESVKGETYPGLISRENSRTHGVIYFDINLADKHRLDMYEGDQYSLHSVKVILLNGEMIPCSTYLFKPEMAHLLTGEKWLFEDNIKGDELLYTC